MSSGAQMGGGSQRMRANRKVVEASCLTCGGGFAFGEEVCACTSCGGYHHARCWDTSNGCQHNSAAAAAVASAPPAAPQVAPVQDVEKVVSPNALCERCNNEIRPGQGYAVYPEAAQGVTGDRRAFWATSVPGSFEKGDAEIRKVDIGLWCETCANSVFTRKVWDEAKGFRVEMDSQDAITLDGRRARSEVLDYAIALPAKRRGLTPEQARNEAHELGELWWKDQNAVRQRLTVADAVAVPVRLEPGKPKDCPNCRLVNPGSTARCDCGYDFSLGKMQSPPAAADVALVLSDASSHQPTPGSALAADEQYCPQCREIIKLAALKCRFCGYVLSERLNSQTIPSHVAEEVKSQANKALWCGIFGLFICAPILGSMAISSGNKAIETLDRYPFYAGPRGRAQAGRVMGWLGWIFIVIYFIGQMANTVNSVPR